MSQTNLTGAELAAELAARDIDGMDAPAVEAAVRSLAKVRSWVDAYEARLAARAKKLAVGGSTVSSQKRRDRRSRYSANRR